MAAKKKPTSRGFDWRVLDRFWTGFIVGIAFCVTVFAIGIATYSVDETAHERGDRRLSSLRLPSDQVAAACSEVTPEALEGADKAFKARVERIEGDEVTLTVIQRYTGKVAGTVTVAQQTADVASEISVGPFEDDTEYLIATNGKTIQACGRSGEATSELEAIYREAFN